MSVIELNGPLSAREAAGLVFQAGSVVASDECITIRWREGSRVREITGEAQDLTSMLAQRVNPNDPAAAYRQIQRELLGLVGRSISADASQSALNQAISQVGALRLIDQAVDVNEGYHTPSPAPHCRDGNAIS